MITALLEKLFQGEKRYHDDASSSCVKRSRDDNREIEVSYRKPTENNVVTDVAGLHSQFFDLYRLSQNDRVSIYHKGLQILQVHHFLTNSQRG